MNDYKNTFLQIAGPLVKKTDWEERMREYKTNPLSYPSDGTFGDVVSLFNTPIGDLGLVKIFWAYGKFLCDKKLHADVVQCVLPMTTDVVLNTLAHTPINEQNTAELINFSSNYKKTLNSGQFNKEQAESIDKIVRQIDKSLRMQNG